jgi:hypothetical protein
MDSSASLWAKDFGAYQRIIELVRESEDEIVEQYIKKVMARIAATAYESWESLRIADSTADGKRFSSYRIPLP